MANQSQIKISKVAHFKGHLDAVYDFDLDKENSKIYSAGSDGYIVQWSSESEEGKLVLKTDQAFYTVFFEPETEFLYAGTRTGQIYKIDITKAQLLSSDSVHKGSVFFIDYWNRNLLSGGADGVLKIGDQTIKLSNDSLRSVSHSEDKLFVGSSDGLIYILNGRYELLTTLKGHSNSVFSLCLIGEDYLLSTGRDALIKLWDLKAFNEVLSVPAHNYQAKSLSFNGAHILSSSMDKTIKIWNEELNLLKVIDFNRNESHTNCINKVEWLNSTQFVSCSDDRSLMLWQIEIN